MTVLTVRRPSPNQRSQLLFQGKRLPLGTEIETRDYPAVRADKWAQLIRLGILRDEQLTATPDIVRELRAQRDEYGDAPLVQTPMDATFVIPESPELPPVPGTGSVCGECGFEAKNANGLKVHVGRSHAKKE